MATRTAPQITLRSFDVEQSVPSPFAVTQAPQTNFFNAGSEIYGQGEKAGHIYQVEFGAVRTYRLLADGRRQISAFHLAGEVFAIASARAKTHLEQAVADDPELRRLLDEVQRRELDPLTAVREIMQKVFKVNTDGD
jgi:CRP/FNR family transcriptional regulator, nitrogen fixation regulation protein